MLCLFILFHFGCGQEGSKLLPDPILKKGDFWVNHFDALHISKGTIVYKDDRLYCNDGSFRSDDSARFFCLDLKSGRILWDNPVDQSATYNPIVLNDVIYYITTTGNRYTYDTSGRQILFKLNGSDSPVYSPTISTYNQINHNLIINDVIGPFNEFDKETGLLSHTGLKKGEEAIWTLPAYMNKYIYYILKGDSVGKRHTIEKYWPALVCRNTINNKDVWRIPNFKCENLYIKNGNLYAFTSHTINCFDGYSGKVKWSVDSTKFQTLKFNYSFIYSDDRLLLRGTDTARNLSYNAVDYESGKQLPYKTRANVYTYSIWDPKHNLYEVKVTVGSDKSNNAFGEATEVEVTKSRESNIIKN